MTAHRVLPAALVLSFTLASSLAWSQARPKPPAARTQIRGQVRYAHGPAGPQGILVTLEGERSGLVAQTQTDSQGKFAFVQIAQEVYSIKARHPGYEEVFQRVDLTISPTALVSLELKPLPQQASLSVPPEGPGAMVSLGVMAAPENARKEFEVGNKLLMDGKDPNGSISHFRKAIQLHPPFPQAHVLLGTAYMDLGKWKEAQPALEKAIELDAKLAAAHLALGTCFNQQGNFAAAEKPLLRGLELNPESAEGRYELGRVYWALGRWPEAEPQARKAAELRPEFAAVHVLLGNIMLRKRDAPAALKEFKEYLRLEPKGPLAAPTREMVAKIEKALAASK